MPGERNITSPVSEILMSTFGAAGPTVSARTAPSFWQVT